MCFYVYTHVEIMYACHHIYICMFLNGYIYICVHMKKQNIYVCLYANAYMYQHVCIPSDGVLRGSAIKKTLSVSPRRC